MPDDVEISIWDDGPYEVNGPFTIKCEDGSLVVVEPGEPCFLCRCGGSKTKPFCDGTHDDIGFRGPVAVPTQPRGSN